MPGRQWIGAVLRAKCHHHKCERIQRAGVVGRITEWEEGPDSVELCGVCRLTHVGSVPLWFDHQRCDFSCYRCTNTNCIYVYVVLIHTIYIHVLHWSLMVMDSPSCGHCAGHGGGRKQLWIMWLVMWQVERSQFFLWTELKIVFIGMYIWMQ